MPPKTIRKLSQRKINPAVESAGSGSAPSAASAGSADKKKIKRAAEEDARKQRKDFIASPCPENRPVRKGGPRERLLQYHSPDRRWIAPAPLSPPSHPPQFPFSLPGGRSGRWL